MTFAEFKASGRDVANLGAPLGDDGLRGVPGRLYDQSLYIEQLPTTEWVLTLGNMQYHESLADLEARLYQFGVSEGAVPTYDVWEVRAGLIPTGVGVTLAEIIPDAEEREEVYRTLEDPRNAYTLIGGGAAPLFRIAKHGVLPWEAR